MPFVLPNDNIILMDYMENPLSVEECKRVKACGVNLLLHFVEWQKIQQSPVMDLSTVDAVVEKCAASGLKAILMTYNQAPTYLPVDMYAKGQHGEVLNSVPWSVLSYWNPEARNFNDAFIQFMVERYNSPTVICINSMIKEGESIFPPGVYPWYDSCAQEDWNKAKETQSLANWLLESAWTALFRQQKIFWEHPSHELWMSLHHAFEGNPLNASQPSVYYKRLRKSFPDSQLYSIQFTHYEHGIWQIENVRQDMQDYGVRFFVGAGWAQGLPQSAPWAKRDGLQGLICSPIHPYSGYNHMEPWIYENLEQAVKTMGG